MKYFTSK